MNMKVLIMAKSTNKTPLFPTASKNRAGGRVEKESTLTQKMCPKFLHLKEGEVQEDMKAGRGGWLLREHTGRGA